MRAWGTAATVAALMFAVVEPAVFGQEKPPTTDGYYDLGGFHRPVSTQSVEAQTWFDRGLAMCFAFNHEEAVRCFQRAAAADPGMPMAYWGMAYAWGPNPNNTEIEPHQIAQAALAVQFAKLHSGRAGDLERELIEALGRRYAAPAPEDREPLNRAYADALRDVHRRHGDDPLAAALLAEALMILNPWQYWSPAGEAAAGTQEIVEVLERGLDRRPDHPGLCHFYIHVMEMSPTPEKARAAADRLRDAMPGAGHLVHMPSHIDILRGDYARVIEANRKAIAADDEFVRREGRANFYTVYRIHNYHFLAYGAMFDGQSGLALDAARKLVEQAPEAMIREQTDLLDAFMPTALHVLIRFGRWEEVLEEAEPPAYLPVSRATRHYARALAYAATGRLDSARQEQAAFEAARAQVPETSFLFQNASLDILGVAEAMIEGEIAYREGRLDRAFQRLREAVRRDDALNYDEPWAWMQPARHALGALLLEQERHAEAEQVYREDLRRHPHNPWALHGLAESLEKQGKADEAADVRMQFQRAAVRSDVRIDRSCYCRLGTD